MVDCNATADLAERPDAADAANQQQMVRLRCCKMRFGVYSCNWWIGMHGSRSSAAALRLVHCVVKRVKVSQQ